MRREGNKLEETKTGRERERELHSTRDEVVAETQKKRKKKKVRDTSTRGLACLSIKYILT